MKADGRKRQGRIVESDERETKAEGRMTKAVK